MTIITKAMGEKKPGDKMEQPLVVVDPQTDRKKVGDPESQQDAPGHYLIFRTRVLRFNNMPTICVLLTAILVMSFGIMAGIYLYKQYARDQMQRLSTRWFSFPYDGATKAQLTADELDNRIMYAEANNLMRISRMQNKQIYNNNNNNFDLNNYLTEKFEIDTQKDYEKIYVPDFGNGRQGRFIHDFSINKTGISDIDGKNCFVMPLDREKILPPYNMYDLLKKMYDGYYEVNTEVVRETMKIIKPPITDISTIGTYIAKECQDRPIYMLEKNTSNGVIKRSVNKDQIFVHYAGKKFYEIDIMNMDEIE